MAVPASTSSLLVASGTWMPRHDAELRNVFQESQPDRRAGTASNTDGTARCGAQLLGSPPTTIAPGRMYAGAAEEFAASALFRGMTGAVTRPRAWLITTRRAFKSHSRNLFWVTSSLGTERACKACACAPAWFDSRVTHHSCGRSWKVEHLSATQEIRFRLPTSAPSGFEHDLRATRYAFVARKSRFPLSGSCFGPVSKSGDRTRLKSAGGRFESGAGHHLGAGSGLQLILARSTSGVRLSAVPPFSFPSSHLGEGAPLLTETGTFESCGGSQSSIATLPSSSGKDARFSAGRRGFESRWQYQSPT